MSEPMRKTVWNWALAEPRQRRRREMSRGKRGTAAGGG